MDIALAVEQIYKSAQYTQCGSYAILQQTWTDKRPIPTEAQLSVAWEEIKIELVKIPILSSIKEQIAALDYKALKFIDGSLTEAEYLPFKEQRIALREKYNLVEQATTIEEVNGI